MNLYHFTKIQNFQKLELQFGYVYDISNPERAVLLSCSIVFPELSLQIPIVINREPSKQTIKDLKSITLNPEFIQFLEFVNIKSVVLVFNASELNWLSSSWLQYTLANYKILNDLIRIDNHFYKESNPQIAMYVESQQFTLANWELQTKQPSSFTKATVEPDNELMIMFCTACLFGFIAYLSLPLGFLLVFFVFPIMFKGSR